MTRLSSRLANAVDPRPAEVITQPAEHVDLVSLERGIDGPVMDLVEEINGEKREYAALRGDVQSLRDIAVSMEEFSLLALEGIGDETGLEPQALLAIQYGANQHLRRVGEQLEFPSLESIDVSNLQKTMLSVESLDKMLSKIWDGIVNAAKRAAQSVLAFLGHMKSFTDKMKEKATALKQQLMAIDVDAEGNISSSAAKRLFYGDKTYRQLGEITGKIFSVSDAYLASYIKNTVAESAQLTRDMTTYDSEGIPKINPETLAKYITDEEKRRDAFLALGYGGRPRSSELHDTEANLRIDYSAGLPGGYRFVSVQPVFDSEVAVGEALLVMADAEFEVEKDKSTGSAPSELPVLSRADAIARCDMLIEFGDTYHKAVQASIDAGEKWWKIEDNADKFEEAISKIHVLSNTDMKKLQKVPSVAEAIGAGMATGIRILTAAASASALVALGMSGDFVLAIATFGGVYWGYFIPTVLAGGALGLLLRQMFTKAGKPSELYFKSTDPNAPMLSLLRGIATSRSWIGMYTVDTVYAVGEYYTKLAPAVLEHIADSAKAHLVAQKATASAAPTAA